jgi:hypothetical protein
MGIRVGEGGIESEEGDGRVYRGGVKITINREN